MICITSRPRQLIISFSLLQWFFLFFASIVQASHLLLCSAQASCGVLNHSRLVLRLSPLLGGKREQK
ncbi:hypothetical protein BJX76DRAFT_315448 [Aspergillus varians]